MSHTEWDFEMDRADKRAIIYARVSSPNQVRKGDGLASQEATCRQYAERMGYDVVEVFRDNVTGGVTDRPAMGALIKFLRTRRADKLVVIVDHPNRFSRDIRGHWDLRDLLTAAGGRLESPNMKFGDSSAERLVENLMMSTAQYQREQNAEQTKDRMKGRLLNGFWPFIPPRGMRQERVAGVGNILVRVEPEASVIAEGLEAFATGRLCSQAELARWLNEHPDFSKGRRTRITNQQAHDLLTNVLYGGVVEKADWGVTRRKGRHEGLVSYETFERIQQRLIDGSRAPMRTDLNVDFPLRGAVVCASCDHPLTACWSTSKTGAKHPYYMCFKRGCSEYRKSIRRDVIEGEFAGVLDQLTPSAKLMDLAMAMFKDAWDQRSAQASAMAAHYKRELATVETSIARLVDRIVESTTDAVVRACEARIAEHERTKLVLLEKAGQTLPKAGKFDELFELAFEFLANPSKLWDSGRYDYRRLVLRMTFSDKLAYSAKTGFRTPETTLPFNVLGGLGEGVEGMAERKGFEPLRRLPAYTLSRRAPSTTRPSLRAAGAGDIGLCRTGRDEGAEHPSKGGGNILMEGGAARPENMGCGAVPARRRHTLCRPDAACKKGRTPWWFTGRRGSGGGKWRHAAPAPDHRYIADRLRGDPGDHRRHQIAGRQRHRDHAAARQLDPDAPAKPCGGS